MIDNFDKFKREFAPGQFYFVQLIVRGKDFWKAEIWNRNSARCVKTYYVRNQEYLDKHKLEMIDLAHSTWARIYIHPSKRDENKIALELIQYIAWRVADGNCTCLDKCYETICGKHIPKEKIRVVDFDGKPVANDKIWISNFDSKFEIEKSVLVYKILKCRGSENRIVNVLDTKNGFHILTRPFDLSQFTYDGVVDIHKNNPTVLYVP